MLSCRRASDASPCGTPRETERDGDGGDGHAGDLPEHRLGREQVNQLSRDGHAQCGNQSYQLGALRFGVSSAAEARSETVCVLNPAPSMAAMTGCHAVDGASTANTRPGRSNCSRASGKPSRARRIWKFLRPGNPWRGCAATDFRQWALHVQPGPNRPPSCNSRAHAAASHRGRGGFRRGCGRARDETWAVARRMRAFESL